MTGDVERLLAVERPAAAAGRDSVVRAIGLGLAGRRDEARRASPSGPAGGAARGLPAVDADTLLHWLDRRPAAMREGVEALGGLRIMDDPEARFRQGWLLCDVGEPDRGLELLRRAVAKGYAVAPTLAGSRAFDALRTDPRFLELLARAEADREEALRAFREGGGEAPRPLRGAGEPPGADLVRRRGLRRDPPERSRRRRGRPGHRADSLGRDARQSAALEAGLPPSSTATVTASCPRHPRRGAVGARDLHAAGLGDRHHGRHGQGHGWPS